MTEYTHNGVTYQLVKADNTRNNPCNGCYFDKGKCIFPEGLEYINPCCEDSTYVWQVKPGLTDSEFQQVYE